jgi:hypothetical protein
MAVNTSKIQKLNTLICIIRPYITIITVIKGDFKTKNLNFISNHTIITDITVILTSLNNIWRLKTTFINI